MKPQTVIPSSLAMLVLACQGDLPETSEHVRSVQIGGSLSGAIFTTLEDGSSVNANIYEDKEDVYLDGGPGPNAPASAAGLPEGDYYFQVTDPSGKDLLSTDHISCRRVHVNENGVIDQSYPGTNYVKDKGQWVATPCQHQTGIDSDHAELGAITVQLMPYDDTPNPGGVYKAWMTPVDDYVGDPDYAPSKGGDPVNGEGWAPNDFHGFVPADSKTDNYKVKRKGKPCDPQMLSIRKFHDQNLNGVQDLGEETVDGWPVEVFDSLGGSNSVFTTALLFAEPGWWTATESVLDGSMQTASYLDGVQLSSYPSASPTVDVLFSEECGESHDIAYGNVGIGSITACKVYDRDADGNADDDEPTIPGWQFQLSGTDAAGGAVGPLTQTAGDDGCTVFANLLPGSYAVTELMPAGDEWFATGDVSQNVTIESNAGAGTIQGTAALVEFTNGCQASADFGTKGYWHNKNGLAEITESDIDLVNTLAPYSAPSSYFDNGDEEFDGFFEDGTPVDDALASEELLAAAGTALAEISHFLVDPNQGGDPREQLAQQLLAFIFNTLHRTGGIGSAIEAEDGTWMNTATLIDGAIAAWLGGTPEEQEAIKTLLDTFNNDDDVGYVPFDPCDVNY